MSEVKDVVEGTTTAPAPTPVPTPPPDGQPADPTAPVPNATPPVDPLAPAEQSPLEQRVAAVEKLFDDLNEHVVKSIGTRLMVIDEGMQDITKAWTEFAQAGTRVLEECRALAQASENAGVVELDRRLKIIEASRV